MPERHRERSLETPTKEGDNEQIISPEEIAKLGIIIEKYLVENKKLIKAINNKDIDYILAKYIESGSELSPGDKAALHKIIQKMLGIKLKKDK